jgi:flagellar biosynthesis protein FliQ
MKIHLDIWVLIVALTVSLVVAKRQVKQYLRFFPLFLMITVIVELTGTWMSSLHRNNTLLYNIYTIFQFSFYLYFFTLILDSRFLKPLNILRIVLPVFGLFDLLLIQGPSVYNTYHYVLGCLSVDTFAVIYFIQLFNRPEKIVLAKEPSFWIVTGLAFHFITSMSFLGIVNYVSTLPPNVSSQLVHLLVMVNVLLYILFIIAFLCRLNTRRSIYNT